MSENSRFANLGLALVVIRSDDIERAADFYRALGLRLVKHAHPPCGEHYSTEGSRLVFEICKLKPGQAPTTSTMIGFEVTSIDEAVKAAVLNGGGVKRAAEATQWGTTAIVTDPDGHGVFLVESETAAKMRE